MIGINRNVFRTVLLPILFGFGSVTIGGTEANLLLDDFSSPGESAIGTRWEGFTDRVMGGMSDMQAGYARDGDASVLRMTGSVSLENNGGFIQVRMPLASRGTLDASGYSGVSLEVRAAPGDYYLHIRTRSTRLPWQYFEARIEAGQEWSTVNIPFASFDAQSTLSHMNTAQLRSIAIVGGKAEFDADISVRRIEFYR
jgi:hypothetical protein